VSGGRVLRIPIMETHVRSLNLAVASGIGLYEAIRQIDGPI
jgi:tRNA (cytidine/uridine-2'-O-)-methyltransferase